MIAYYAFCCDIFVYVYAYIHVCINIYTYYVCIQAKELNISPKAFLRNQMVYQAAKFAVRHIHIYIYVYLYLYVRVYMYLYVRVCLYI